MIMCATLVKAGFYSTWEEAFEKGVKPKRPVSEEYSCDYNDCSKKKAHITDTFLSILCLFVSTFPYSHHNLCNLH